jgi:hypothetical protein
VRVLLRQDFSTAQYTKRNVRAQIFLPNSGVFTATACGLLISTSDALGMRVPSFSASGQLCGR